MFKYEELENRYLRDAPFNKMTNLFRQLIEQYGFQPDEIRQSLFLAQYMYQMNHAEQIYRTEKEWEELSKARLLMQAVVLQDYEKILNELLGYKNV